MEYIKKKPSFDAEKATLLVKELRESFNSGKTKSYKWRISQLECIAKMLKEREKDIIAAVDKDLSKPGFEAFMSEVTNFKANVSMLQKYSTYNLLSVYFLSSWSQILCMRFLMQVSQSKSSCSEALKQLKHWMKPEKVITKNNNDNKSIQARFMIKQFN